MIEKICERLEKEYDLADKEKARCITENSLQFDRANGYASGIDTAIQIVQEVAKEYDWVSVKDRLPEPFQRVLVYDAWDDSMTIEHLQENDSFIDSVVAWMHLPIAPYQKGE